MAWTTPIQFVSNAVLTAAQLNTTIRDNLLETMAAKALGVEGEYFATSGYNQISSRAVMYNSIFNITDRTTSSSYVDLASFGPSVTGETGTTAIAFVSAMMQKNAGSDVRNEAVIGIEVSGASGRIEPNDDDSLKCAREDQGVAQFSHLIYFTDLTPGSNTFTMKYKISGGTCYFSRRTLIVMPF